jgi:superoxide reductase
MNVYICSLCGHIEFNAMPAVCPVCKAPAEKFVQNNKVFEESAQKSKEAAVKHVPVVTVNKKCGLIPEQPCVDVVVRIGATLHPMESAHFIQFIDCYVDAKYISRILLTPGVFASGVFHLKTSGSKVTIVENCNLHGYWQTETSL